MIISRKDVKLIENARSDEYVLHEVCSAVLPKYLKNYSMGNSQEFVDHVIDNTVYTLLYMDEQDHAAKDDYDLALNIEYWLWRAYCMELVTTLIDGNRRLWPNLLPHEAHDLLREHNVAKKVCDLTMPLNDAQKHATATAFILGCIYTLFDTNTCNDDWT